MPTVKAATKKTVKTAKKVTLDDVWATIDEIGKAHKETEKALKETQRIVSGLGASHKETEAGFRELQQAHKETEKVQKETQRIVSGLGASHKETEAGFRELQQAHKETEKVQKETQRIVGDLGNKFGEEAEYTMLPGLPEKFKQFGFDFSVINRNRKINNDKHDIHAEIDAFLENGTQAMAVEVKAKLQNSDVDDHIKRMGKLRKYADIFGDKRELFGALAAVVVNEKAKNYALKNGFYVIEPSGEDVNIIKPDSDPRVW
ncbi:hypothetical protein AGMMS49944_01430 [Spirochaetia bacterium]|nr:hypothetical protein AGMMS49944_01430 [Spirochaetia bacterium]